MRQDVNTVCDTMLLRERLERWALFAATPAGDDEPPRDGRSTTTDLLKGAQQEYVPFALVEIPDGEKHQFTRLPADLGAHPPGIPRANRHTVGNDGESFRWKAK